MSVLVTQTCISNVDFSRSVMKELLSTTIRFILIQGQCVESLPAM